MLIQYSILYKFEVASACTFASQRSFGNLDPSIWVSCVSPLNVWAFSSCSVHAYAAVMSKAGQASGLKSSRCPWFTTLLAYSIIHDWHEPINMHQLWLTSTMIKQGVQLEWMLVCLHHRSLLHSHQPWACPYCHTCTPRSAGWSVTPYDSVVLQVPV